MANVMVRGGSTTQKKYVSSIAEYSLNKLVSSRLNKSLKIEIHLKKNLLSASGTLGDAIYMDDEPTRRPKEFLVRADSTIQLRNLLVTVAHELVHVKQWATGEMYEYHNVCGTTRFKDKKINTDKTDYWDFPWEIEAHGREMGLFIRWAEESGLSAKSWAQVEY